MPIKDMPRTTPAQPRTTPWNHIEWSPKQGKLGFLKEKLGFLKEKLRFPKEKLRFL